MCSAMRKDRESRKYSPDKQVLIYQSLDKATPAPAETQTKPAQTDKPKVRPRTHRSRKKVQ